VARFCGTRDTEFDLQMRMLRIHSFYFTLKIYLHLLFCFRGYSFDAEIIADALY
jgi:hypothetical protein